MCDQTQGKGKKGNKNGKQVLKDGLYGAASSTLVTIVEQSAHQCHCRPRRHCHFLKFFREKESTDSISETTWSSVYNPKCFGGRTDNISRKSPYSTADVVFSQVPSCGLHSPPVLHTFSQRLLVSCPLRHPFQPQSTYTDSEPLSVRQFRVAQVWS